jgi:hypothetical protein
VKNMGSSGKKKTTMAKHARENRLRERRLNKQAKRDARKQTSSDHPDPRQGSPEAGMAQSIPDPTLAAHEPVVQAAASDRQVSTLGHADEAVHAFRQVDPEPTDPRAKEVALHRLRDAPDEELAVFEGKLQAGALEAGATEQEMRDAQRDHPGHDA